SPSALSAPSAGGRASEATCYTDCVLLLLGGAMKQATNDVGLVTDQELMGRLGRLVRADRTLSARLLVHLGEVDARGLYREHAYPSMFAYCVEELSMSEAEAYLRIQAARLGRQFPVIVPLFARGALHLSALFFSWAVL